jgi:hypothetical protein
MPTREPKRREPSSARRTESAIDALRLIPTKWAIAIVVSLIGYVLLQPRLNQWFGWSLPSLANLVGDESPKKKESPKRNPPSENATPQKRTTQEKPASEQTPEPSSSSNGSRSLSKDKENSETKGSRNAAENQAGTASAEFLKEIAKDRFESPAGLIYGRGSEEGHRLKHIARHLEDIPDRPGSHGVFRGSMDEFLRAIDDAYTRAKRGAKGTKKSEDNGRTIYEASFEKAIGYLGGQTGQRKKNPSLKRLQIVVERNAVITAFPIQ